MVLGSLKQPMMVHSISLDSLVCNRLGKMDRIPYSNALDKGVHIGLGCNC